MKTKKSKRRSGPRPSGKREREKQEAALHEAQGEIEEAIGVVAATLKSFQAVQADEGRAQPTDVEDQIAALGVGVKCLREAFGKLCAAILGGAAVTREVWTDYMIRDCAGRCVSSMFLSSRFLQDFITVEKLGAEMIAKLREGGLTVLPRLTA